MRSSTSPAVATSRGTVTFLFTDIEGSTQLLQMLGDRWSAVLEAHAALLEETFGRHGGRVVDTAGDGFFAVFEGARPALAAAADAQRAIAAHPWPDAVAVRVRMGLHTGEPLVGPTGYIGLDVHRAARIAAAAHGGQILVSETTRQLVAGELPAGVTLRSLGEHRLKDLPDPERLHQAVVASLPSEFPPPRGVGGASRLPQPVTPLLGRERELERLIALVREPGVRLVTLTGPGGTGKTRLALEAAHRLRFEFGGRAHFVALVGVREPAGVMPAIARALEVPEMAGESTADAIAAGLGERAALLILDNFEQVVDAAPAVAMLLEAAPALRALVTSRAPLNVRAERELPVSTLAVPDPGIVDAEELRAYPAVELFLERAAGARPSLGRDPDDLLAVAEVCRRLDGLPLAIELAAARARLFPPRVLLSRLHHRLELLSSGPRDLPERHRTLREAIGWSHDLLEPGDRTLFRRLGLFPGGFSFEAAEVVAAAAPGASPPLEGVASLLERSLVRRVEGDDDGRFVMLETIREYALEQLDASGEAAAIRAAAATHLIELAEAAEPALTSRSPDRSLEIHDAETDNLRAAFDWLDADGRIEDALRLGAALWRYWVIRGRHAEGLERLRALIGAAGQRPFEAVMRRVLTGAATLAYEHGHAREARSYLEAVLEHCRGHGDEPTVATTLNHLGWAAFYDSDLAAARTLSEEALALCERIGDRRGTALALNNLAWVDRLVGETGRARQRFERSLALRRDVGDPRGIAYAQLNLSWLRLRQGELDDARAQASEALATLRALGDRQLTPYALYVVGYGTYLAGDGAGAIAVLREGAAAARDIGHAINVGFNLGQLGDALLDLGDPDSARSTYEEAIAMHQRSSLHWGTLSSRRGLAESLARTGEPARARAVLADTCAAAAALPMPVEMAECLEALAGIELEAGASEAAACALGAAAALRERAGAPVPLSRARTVDARIAAARRLAGDTFEAAFAEGRRSAPLLAPRADASAPGRRTD